MNLTALEGLPEFSRGPRSPELADRLASIREAGYEGVQFIEPLKPSEVGLCERLGLGRCSLGRVNDPRDVDVLARRFADEGQECATLHVGWGIEGDAEADALIEAVLEASDRHHVPLFVETHRATIFQDLWRTLQFVRRYPDLRFNGDFSHWYTGLEMVYGGFERKLAFIQPVLERVRFLHGRIGNPGSIQVDIGDGDASQRPYVDHFRRLWIASFAGFLGSTRPGDYILFVPELLAPGIYYGRVFPDATGALREESDRWEQSLVLRRIARECFEAAARQAR